MPVTLGTATTHNGGLRNPHLGHAPGKHHVSAEVLSLADKRWIRAMNAHVGGRINQWLTVGVAVGSDSHTWADEWEIRGT